MAYIVNFTAIITAKVTEGIFPARAKKEAGGDFCDSNK